MTTQTKLYDAREHDRWFREQVEAAVKEADNPDAVWVDHASVMHKAREVIAHAHNKKGKNAA